MDEFEVGSDADGYEVVEWRMRIVVLVAMLLFSRRC
jgi:hypothetical protein